MKLLAIESSCDETAAAVVEDGRKVLSSVVDSQIEEHRKYGGVVPEIASRRHTEAIVWVARRALESANSTDQDLDAIAVTAAPGLIGAVLVGVNFAKGLSLALHKPIVPVHHIRGHVAANYLSHPELQPPFLCLIVSGGHSHIVEVRGYTDYHIIGRTRDDAAGEAIDKAARSLGLCYPGGVELDKRSVTGNPKRYPLPNPKTESPYDFSFSGLKTAVINLVHNTQQKGETICCEDMAASFCDRVSDILWSRFERAAHDLGYTAVALAGGVSANSWLRRRATERCTALGWKLYLPELSLCGDNAAMIGAQGYYEYLAGNLGSMHLNGKPYMEIDRQFEG
ncbi:MAG: tRNA (adenosine(37)-N6)-threonylcarbamoyltransferase complex transferase subunit TsaD [Angelakisella sp.]